ncbi:MAG: flagellin FliC, partial [Candidatus Hydrogenedentes bacterium]|nr:flagellin FliC [Candidatus Hydrogenedentota bacterium]
MGLRINTNVAALNTARILRGTTLSLNKSLERLSSGLRINRAADDAAGLAIAENFRSVVAGSQVAQRNSQDGI